MKQKKRIEITKFNNDENNGKSYEMIYNFFPSNSLSSNLGVCSATFPRSESNTSERELNLSGANIERVDGVTCFRQYFADYNLTVYRLLVYAGDKKLYLNQLLDGDFSVNWLYDLTFENMPVTLSFKKDDLDAIILADNQQMKIWPTNYTPYTLTDTPLITSMCIYENILYCTIQDPAFKIWYSTDWSFSNVDRLGNYSGYISLEDDLGYARKIMNFSEDLIVFRDYGISKIKRVAGEITVSEIYKSNTKIYANTIANCGNVVVFMTREGVYAFNGARVKKLKIDISKYLSGNNDNAAASSLGNKYYVALRLNFDDDQTILCENEVDYVNNALIEYDIVTGEYQILRGVDIKSFLPLKTEVFEKMLLTFNTQNNNKLGQITKTSTCFGVNLPKLWRSENLIYNSDVKLLTSLSINADAGITIKLICDDEDREFETYQTGTNEFNFKIITKNVKIEISTNNSNANVKNIYLDYYEYR